MNTRNILETFTATVEGSYPSTFLFSFFNVAGLFRVSLFIELGDAEDSGNVFELSGQSANSLSVMLFSILCNNVASDNKAAYYEGLDLCFTICF